jgi:polyhydroxyalkanoate synthesis regulator phasin
MSKMKRLKVVRKSTIEDKDARIAELEKQVEMLKTSPNEKTTAMLTIRLLLI